MHLNWYPTLWARAPNTVTIVFIWIVPWNQAKAVCCHGFAPNKWAFAIVIVTTTIKIDWFSPLEKCNNTLIHTQRKHGVRTKSEVMLSHKTQWNTVGKNLRFSSTYKDTMNGMSPLNYQIYTSKNSDQAQALAGTIICCRHISGNQYHIIHVHCNTCNKDRHELKHKEDTNTKTESWLWIRVALFAY